MMDVIRRSSRGLAAIEAACETVGGIQEEILHALLVRLEFYLNALLFFEVFVSNVFMQHLQFIELWRCFDFDAQC